MSECEEKHLSATYFKSTTYFCTVEGQFRNAFSSQINSELNVVQLLIFLYMKYVIMLHKDMLKILQIMDDLQKNDKQFWLKNTSENMSSTIPTK